MLLMSKPYVRAQKCDPHRTGSDGQPWFGACREGCVRVVRA
jgi:hypothetical protein